MIRRAELGKLIADPKNEALAKAFVNRIWAHFLGRGFVNPVDDFGPHNPPSHPELLDKLAKEFKESGYDVKKLCRWIMASRAYQLSSVKSKRDGEGRGPFLPDAAQADDSRAALRFAGDGHRGLIDRARVKESTSSGTPGCGSSSSPSPTTKAEDRPAFRGPFPRRS